MPRFTAIEGLRAWLAWTVVFAHMIYMSGMDAWHPGGSFLFLTGFWAVAVFVMVSGFVITHLLVEKAEPYPQYITRRFMRLFPAFVLATLLGFVAIQYCAGALAHSPATALPGYEVAKRFVGWHLAWTQAWPQNLASHLVMLHGLAPSTEYAFVPPGWSVSLEWQYYLVAPLLLLAVRRFPMITGAVALGLGLVADKLYGSQFASPSTLPQMGFYFVIGIASRLYLRRGRVPSIVPILALGLPLVLKEWDFIPIGVWCAFLCFMAGEHDATESRLAGLVRLAFESAPAKYFGERSYSVYLLHYPLLMLLMPFGLAHFHIGLPLMAFLALATPPLIFVAAELVYRFVEKPGMALGRQWARMLARRRPAVMATT